MINVYVGSTKLNKTGGFAQVFFFDTVFNDTGWECESL